MAWGPASREEFQRIVFSGWGLLAALLFVSGPLLMAYYVSQGFAGDGPTPLHQGARFAYFAYPMSGMGVTPGDVVIPVLLLLGSAIVAARPGMLLGRIAAFGVLAAIAWLVPVVVLGLTFVGVSIVAPAFLAFGVLLLELAIWVALGTIASGARRVAPILAGIVILAVLSFAAVIRDLAGTTVRIAGGLDSFERAEIVRLALNTLSPSSTASALRALLFPGNGGNFSVLEARQADVPGMLLSAWSWAAVLVLWASVVLLLARRAEKRGAVVETQP